MSTLAVTNACSRTVLRTARILDLVAAAHQAGPAVPLIISGESGVGKDMLARLVHADSPRRASTFIKVNCPVQAGKGRCEVDLFGIERGAAPHAARRLIGSLELANHGTIYLDDVGSLPSALLPRLLRVLQTGGVTRTGGSEFIQIDVRVIASDAGVREQRGDEAFWRALRDLDAVELFVPPLRERREEIAEFATFFLERFNRQYRRDVRLRPDAMTTLQAQEWPRNISGLEEEVRRLVVGDGSCRRSPL